MQYIPGSYYYLHSGYCRVLCPTDLKTVTDKFIGRSLYEKILAIQSSYKSPNFILIDLYKEYLLIYYQGKFGYIHCKQGKFCIVKNEP